jgi:hypothetical protein
MPKQIQATTFLFVLLCVGPMVLAQSGACPEIVRIAQQAADQQCINTGRNQACYANVNLNAVPQPGIADFRFTQVGDLADVAAIQSLRLNGMNQETREWGVVVMKLQANLPNSLPGQNVTFLLFGDVEITNAAQENVAPMQAFILRTGVGDSQCQEAPQSGLLVQTPKGVGTINFNVNGVEVAMGSTVYFQAQPGDSMKVRTVEGAAVLKVKNRIVPVIAGTQASVPMDDDLMADGEPSDPEPYDVEIVESLEFDSLERDIEIAEPLDEAEIADILERMEAGEPICGEDFLPSCEEVPVEIGGEPCVMPGSTPAGDEPSRLCDTEALGGDDAPPIPGQPDINDDSNRQPPPDDVPDEIQPPPGNDSPPEGQEGGEMPPSPEDSGGGEPPPPDDSGGED